MNLCSKSIWIFLLAFVSASTARCDFILNNYPGSPTDIGALPADTAMAIGFKVGAAPLTIQSLTLTLQGATAAATPVIEIRPATSAAAVVSFTPQSIAAGALNDYTFTPSTGSTLAADTVYWLTIGADAGSASGIFVAQNTTVPTTALANFTSVKFGPLSDPSVDVPGGSIPGVRLEGISAVPEPSSLALMAVVGGVAGWSQRRRLTKARVTQPA